MKRQVRDFEFRVWQQAPSAPGYLFELSVLCVLMWYCFFLLMKTAR